MTHPKKELHIACNYLLRLIKAHVQLSPEQIRRFKRAFFDILCKRYVDHWFPATPHRGSAYRCLQTKHWKDSVLRSLAERSCLPLHRYLPVIFTMWIDPGEVAVCFGDEGTWCPLYNDEQYHEEFSDGEETVSSLSSDDDLSHLTRNLQTLNVNPTQMQSKENLDSNPSRSSSSLAASSRTSSPFFNAISHSDGSASMYCLDQQQVLSWPQESSQ